LPGSAALSKTNAELVLDELPWVHSLPWKKAMQWYDMVLHDPGCDPDTVAAIGRNDRYFLLTHILGRADASQPWLYDRCREVEENTDGFLDLWARDHYKSTIITYAGAIQEILNDCNITIGIFSHTRPIAKAFQSQIMQEFEKNEFLKEIYQDVLWANPRREAPVWSLDSGIVVKRDTNPKEATVEAWGLVDGQPISKHFRLAIFDDTVTPSSVNTPDQIIKTTEAWELAQNLTSSQHPRTWHVGTRYNFADTYGQLLTRGALVPRVYPATNDGTMDGEPVFLKPDVWQKKVSESSTYTIACQQLQNPVAGSEQELKPEWVRRYELRPLTMNVYIMCDYAGSRKSTGSSRTAFCVVGIDHALNKYLLDGACHKMGLSDRWTMMKQLRRKWMAAPGVQGVWVGYERFGAQSDIEHFEQMMLIENEHFDIQELNWPRDGDVAKDNRIRRLEPDARNWRLFFPYDGEPTSTQIDAIKRGNDHLVAKPIKRKDTDNRLYDLVDYMIRNEWIFFPNTTAKDMLDALSRIYDMDPRAPMIINEDDCLPDYVED